ncbi:hypothetical protein KC19_8G201800 [Ceratodon purpureus]|uniref:Uncharacterized protein n=1 Tax=Ceratodon purpureus TaxID=3225 RepID=A0A8T0H2M8_CERPU|nr:hypothetical protein KC19_8G201800 [Ceratodon purpureus]
MADTAPAQQGQSLPWVVEVESARSHGTELMVFQYIAPMPGTGKRLALANCLSCRAASRHARFASRLLPGPHAMRLHQARIRNQGSLPQQVENYLQLLSNVARETRDAEPRDCWVGDISAVPCSEPYGRQLRLWVLTHKRHVLVLFDYSRL